MLLDLPRRPGSYNCLLDNWTFGGSWDSWKTEACGCNTGHKNVLCQFSSLPIQFYFYLMANNCHYMIWQCWILNIKTNSFYISKLSQSSKATLAQRTIARQDLNNRKQHSRQGPGSDTPMKALRAKLLRHLYIFYVKFLSARSPLRVCLCSGGLRD